jgi:precorrin-8X/cobalt-precorrin-8 methylmutase
VSRAIVHPIERESYRILRRRIDLSHLPSLSLAVCERVIHASADLEYAHTLVLDEEALRSGRDALERGRPIVVDSRMVGAAITSRETWAPIADTQAAKIASEQALTRSAAAMRLAARAVGPGAVWVIGCAPTALDELIALGGARAALVIGLPVGFVGAAEAKARLAASGLACLTNRGEKGGSAVAAAALNALLYTDPEDAND